MVRPYRSTTAWVAALTVLAASPSYACGCCGGGDKTKVEAAVPNQSSPTKSAGGCMGGMKDGSGKSAMSCGGGMASMDMDQKASDDKMMGGMDHSKMEMDHSKMDMPKPPATTAADQAFINTMIPIRQSAVAMAVEYLKTGGDTELRKLAENIVKAHESELALLKTWKPKDAK